MNLFEIIVEIEKMNLETAKGVKQMKDAVTALRKAEQDLEDFNNA